MRNKFLLKVDVVENKNRIFVHISKKPNVVVTENEVRKKLQEMKIFPLNLLSQGEKLYVFESRKQQVKMTDLTESYGASELPVFTPEVEEKPKPTRKTTTRKPRTRRKTSTTKKQTEN